MNNNLNMIDSNSDEINIGRIIRTLFLQSRLILFISLIGLIFSLIYLTLTPKSYQIKSLIQVYDNSSGIYGSSSPSDMFLGSSSSDDVELLVNLYKTRTNILKIIEEFNLNLIIDQDYEIDVTHFKLKDLELGKTKKFQLIKKPNYYEIFDENENLILSNSYNNLYEDTNIRVDLKNNPEYHNMPIDIIYINPSDLYLAYYNLFSLNTLSGNSFMSTDGFISINFVSNDRELGKDIVNYANNLFVKKTIEFETEKARKAINFIDNQLLSLNQVLEVKKANLKQFKEKNQSINVDLEIQSIIDSIAKLEENLNSIEIDLAEASSLYTSTNPIFRSIDDRKTVLLNQKKEIEKRVKDLPIAEQQYIDLYRDVEISQQLYLDLANRKLGYSIMEASTIGNIRIVDDAYIAEKVSPNLTFAFFISFVFFAISILVALINGYYFMRVTNPAEINDEGINNKIYGVIPNRDDDDDDINFNRSIESAILNIESIEPSDQINSKLILITSPTEDNGKSLISRHISKRLAEMNRKTLLIDNDLIRGNQHHFFSKKKISFDDFMKINKDNIEDFYISDDLYFIPKVSRLSDSFNFLYNDAYLNKINEIKEIFDYVVFDSAPVLSVSDTSILMNYSDISLLVIRHNISKISQIKQAMYLSNQINQEFHGIIYNAYEKPNTSYGYYGAYGDYRYQYYADKYLYNSYIKEDD